MTVLHLALVVFALVNSETEPHYLIADFSGLEKKCENEELANKLHSESPHRCYFIGGEDIDERAWEECKRRLSSRLIASCPNNQIKKVILNLLNMQIK